MTYKVMPLDIKQALSAERVKSGQVQLPGWLQDLVEDYKSTWEPDSKGGEPNHRPEPTGV